MKNEIINIYVNNKIILRNLLKRKKYFDQFKTSFFNIDFNNSKNHDNNSISVFFVPLEYNKSDNTSFLKYISCLNPIKTILCISKNYTNIFSVWKGYTFFYPISFGDLEKKINILKISNNIVFKELELDRKNNLLININKKSKIKLTQIEANIIGILMKSQNHVSRKDLNFIALGYNKEVDSHSLDSHIYRLRKKLFTVSTKHEILSKKKGCYQIV